jgi:hypothetical protein
VVRRLPLDGALWALAGSLPDLQTPLDGTFAERTGRVKGIKHLAIDWGYPPCQFDFWNEPSDSSRWI